MKTFLIGVIKTLLFYLFIVVYFSVVFLTTTAVLDELAYYTGYYAEGYLESKALYETN